MEDINKSQAGLTGTIEMDFQDKVAILRMRRGQNRFNFSFISSMNAALDEVEKSDAEVLITTGDGKFYSNGIDLDWMKLLEDHSKEERLKFRDELHQLIARVLTFPMVTIAAINEIANMNSKFRNWFLNYLFNDTKPLYIGHAFAGGGFLALAHDYRLMTSDRGWWCLNEVFLGMNFGSFLKNLIRMKLPSGMPAHEAVVLGQRFTSQRALQSGIVQMECERSQLIARAIEVGKKVTAAQPYPRKNLANMKGDIYSEVLGKLGHTLPTQSNL